MDKQFKNAEEKIIYNIWHQLTDGINVGQLNAWDIKDIDSVTVTDHDKELVAVKFFMDGTNFTGTVLAAYNIGNDTYSIYLIKRKEDKFFRIERDIHLPQLQKRFFELVERPAEWSDEEYEFEQDAHIHLDLPQRLIEEMNEEAEEELKRLNKNG